MDTSNLYRDMCYRSKEIQNKVSEFGGRNDFYAYITIGKVQYPVWLPRQDQLQSMLHISKHSKLWVAVYDSADLIWIVTENKQSRYNFQSYEQNWLAFIMFEKYNKVWNPKTQEWGLLYNKEG